MNPSIIQEAKREELTFGGMRAMETKKDFTFFATSILCVVMTKDGKKKTSSEIYEL